MPLRLGRSLRQPPRNLVCNEIEGKLSYTPFWKCTVCALCRYPSYILMITVYAVRRYSSQVGSLVWLRIAQPKMSRFGAILNNQPSGNRKSHHHHHYHPNLSLSAWAPSKWLQGQFWKWYNSGNKNCKKAFTQSALSKVGPIAFYKKSSGELMATVMRMISSLWGETLEVWNQQTPVPRVKMGRGQLIFVLSPWS